MTLQTAKNLYRKANKKYNFAKRMGLPSHNYPAITKRQCKDKLSHVDAVKFDEWCGKYNALVEELKK